jgi:uncharacterized repeat protein (TIGR01451 family)
MRRPSALSDGTRARRRGPLLAAMVAALAGASVFLLSGAVVAGAAPSCPTANVLSGSNFEIDTNANLTVDGGGTCIDWLADGSGSAMRPGVITKNDLPSGTSDNSFGQGTQENDVNPTIVAGSIPPNKSDLKTFGLYAEGGTSPQFLELFWSRVQNPSGTTNMDFELNQKFCDPSATPTNCSTNGVTPVRTLGDKLITYDLANGGTVPTISIRTWTGSVWGPPTDLSGAGEAVGSVNTSAITAADSGGLGALDSFTFGEAAIPIAALFPNLGEVQCGTLGSAFLKSRSSDSFQAEIKDFIAPVSVGISNCVTPSLTTTASGPVTVGQAIHDVAHLSGGASPTGSITFQVFAPGDTTCQTPIAVPPAQTVSGNADYTSGDYTTSQTGDYRWRAFYSGDTNNNAVSTSCNDANESSTVINPHISVVKTPDEQVVLAGSTVSFTIQVINDGDSTLGDVKVTDAQAPGCARTSADIAGLASMPPAPAPGSTVTYQCTLANVTASFTNTAVATGKPPVGPNVSSQDTAHVTVVQPVTHPSISIVKNPKSQTVTSGGTATFTITVTNTGDVTLTNVTVSDPLSPNCNKTIGTLAPGASSSYTCTRANVTASFNNVAVASGTAGGTTVTAQDTAPVTAKAAALKPKTVVKPKVVSHRKPKATG